MKEAIVSVLNAVKHGMVKMTKLDDIEVTQEEYDEQTEEARLEWKE